jgi:hypothetical protein
MPSRGRIATLRKDGKDVPLESGERRLALRVEDHPLESAEFEGEIQPGQYGAGALEM